MYQKENLATSITAIDILIKLGWQINNIKSGFKKVFSNTGLLGRWQVLQKNPNIICDVAHNQNGIKKIITPLKLIKYNKLHIVFGTVNDKSVALLSADDDCAIISTLIAFNPKDLNKIEA